MDLYDAIDFMDSGSRRVGGLWQYGARESCPERKTADSFLGRCLGGARKFVGAGISLGRCLDDALDSFLGRFLHLAMFGQAIFKGACLCQDGVSSNFLAGAFLEQRLDGVRGNFHARSRYILGSSTAFLVGDYI